jgi:hypothetical protein
VGYTPYVFGEEIKPCSVLLNSVTIYDTFQVLDIWANSLAVW